MILAFFGIGNDHKSSQVDFIPTDGFFWMGKIDYGECTIKQASFGNQAGKTLKMGLCKELLTNLTDDDIACIKKSYNLIEKILNRHNIKFDQSKK